MTSLAATRRGGAALRVLPAICLALTVGCADEPANFDTIQRWDGIACSGLPEVQAVTMDVIHYDTREVTDSGWIRMLRDQCWDYRDDSGELGDNGTPEEVRRTLLQLIGADHLVATRGEQVVRWSVERSELQPALGRTVHDLIVDDPWFGPFPVRLGVPEGPNAGAVLVHPGHGEVDAEDFFGHGDAGFDRLAREFVTVGVGQLDYRSEPGEQLASSIVHVVGTSKWGIHLWRAMLAHDLAEQLGHDPVAVIGHSMGGILAFVQGIIDHRLEVAHGDANWFNTCLDGPALLDSTPGLHAGGVHGWYWPSGVAATVPVWMEVGYGEIDADAFVDAVHARLATEPTPRAALFDDTPPSFIQGDAGSIEVPEDLQEPIHPAPGLVQTLRRVATIADRGPGAEPIETLVNRPQLDRMQEGIEAGCTTDTMRLWAPNGWGARDAVLVRPREAPTSIVALVPSWSRLDATDALELAEALALQRGALVLVLPDLLPGRLDGLGGVVITTGVEAMGASVVGIATDQLVTALRWAAKEVPGGAELPRVVLTEGRSEAFVGSLAAWTDEGLRVVVHEERTVRGLVEANFEDTEALEGLKWFDPFAEPALSFGRVRPGDDDALLCPAAHDWHPGLAEVDLPALHDHVRPRVLVEPGLTFDRVTPNLEVFDHLMDR